MKLHKLTKVFSVILAAMLILSALPGAALSVRAADAMAQAIWTEGDKTLTFISSETVYSVNDSFNGQTVTGVWSGEEVTDTDDEEPLWIEAAGDLIEKAVFDESFAAVRPRSLSAWFNRCGNLNEITGLTNLNTSETVYLNGMFAYCASLTSLDLSSFDLSSAEECGGMFIGCLGLKSLDLSVLDFSHVEYAEEMFYGSMNLENVFCLNSDSVWQFGNEDPAEVLFDAEHLLNLSGKYGEAAVLYSKSNVRRDYARSAKLGGYLTPKYLTVRFDANGGSGSMEQKEMYSSFFDAEGTALPENTFARENYEFAGWNTKADGSGVLYEDQALFAPSEDLTLFAQWAEKGHEHQAGEETRENEAAPTCEKEGSYDLVVRCTGCGVVLTRTTVKVPALGHDWNEAVFTWDDELESAIATRTCKNDPPHGETVNAVITSAVTKEPTATEDGVRTYTAEATFSDGTKATDTKTEVIPATGEPVAETWTWTRIAGSTRYNTMKAITQEAYKESEKNTLKTLILATGESFPDALSGAALAGVYDCPIILTAAKSLSSQAKSEIQRLAAKDCTVLILGGTGAVSQAVEDAVKALGVKVERVAGSTRLKTASAVYNKGLAAANGFKGNDTVIITTGYNYADALSISPYAYAAKTPILLANKDGSLAADVKNLIKSAGFKKAIIVGGTGAVAAATETYLKDQKLTTLRLSGNTRYQTSAAIMKWEMGLNTSAAIQPAVKLTNAGMGVATGENYPDALASAGLLGKTRSALMLVDAAKKANKTALEKNIAELIKPYADKMGKGYIFGGTGAVTQEIEDLLNEAAGTLRRRS